MSILDPFILLGKSVLALLLLCLTAELLVAQEIQVKVLNARNGKPITNECLNVWIGTIYGAHMVAATNKEGIAKLYLEKNEIVADSTCLGWTGRAFRPTGVDAISLTGDKYISCQEYGKFALGEPPTSNSLKKMMPSYPIKEILESGMSSANTCGKFRTKAKPGELIFLERPRSFWEHLKQ